MRLLTFLLLTALSFGKVDSILIYEGDYARCHTLLEEMLPAAAPGRERAEVLTRLAEVSMLLGEQQQDKAAKQAWFTKGIAYAEQVIQAAPSLPDGYMWHSANLGRDCQTRKINDQIAADRCSTRSSSRG